MKKARLLQVFLGVVLLLAVVLFWGSHPGARRLCR